MKRENLFSAFKGQDSRGQHEACRRRSVKNVGNDDQTNSAFSALFFKVVNKHKLELDKKIKLFLVYTSTMPT